MQVELLYFEGCESYPRALALLERLLETRAVDARIELRRIGTEEEARRERFLGSPTVRVDGRDVEPGAESRTTFGLQCRVYPHEGRLEPTPPANWILSALGAGESAPVLVCRHQAFVAAPLIDVWELVGNPSRHPEWWPELVEVQGERFGRGCAYCQVSQGDGERVETKLRVERVEELEELLVRCDESGLYMRWLLTEAQGGTFVDAEFGIDSARARAPAPDFDAEASKHTLRGWLQTSLDGLADVAGVTRAD